MSEVSDIIDAITATGLFSKVRWIVAEADPDTQPTDLPLCIVGDGGRDFDGLKTFCGGGDLFLQSYSMSILAEDSVAVDTLTLAVQTALIGIVSMDSNEITYDPDLRAYAAESTWS